MIAYTSPRICIYFINPCTSHHVAHLFSNTVLYCELIIVYFIYINKNLLPHHERSLLKIGSTCLFFFCVWKVFFYSALANLEHLRQLAKLSRYICYSLLTFHHINCLCSIWKTTRKNWTKCYSSRKSAASTRMLKTTPSSNKRETVVSPSNTRT